MKIQQKFRMKFTDKLRLKEGVTMAGLRYSLPYEVVTKMETMKKRIDAASQKNISPQIEKVEPAEV